MNCGECVEASDRLRVRAEAAEQRLREVRAEAGFLREARDMLAADNEALKARIAELGRECDECSMNPI